MMNNEQNSMFGIPNQVPLNNQTAPNNNTIPGVNLTPMTPNSIASTPSNSQEVNLNSIIGGQPQPQPQPTPAPITPEALTPNPILGIVTGTKPVNTPNIHNTPINTLPNKNLVSVNNDNVIPGIVEGTQNKTVNDNLMPGLSQTITTPDANQVSPLNQATPVLEQPVLSPNIPINQPNMTNTPMNNNLGDATPLTNETADNGGSEVVSVSKYLLTFILFIIPIVGTIMLFVKAFGGEKNKNIKNLARAQLLFILIMSVLSIVVFMVVIPTMFNKLTESGNSVSNNSSYYDYFFDY